MPDYLAEQVQAAREEKNDGRLAFLLALVAAERSIARSLQRMKDSLAAAIALAVADSQITPAEHAAIQRAIKAHADRLRVDMESLAATVVTDSATYGAQQAMQDIALALGISIALNAIGNTPEMAAAHVIRFGKTGAPVADRIQRATGDIRFRLDIELSRAFALAEGPKKLAQRTTTVIEKSAGVLERVMVTTGADAFARAQTQWPVDRGVEVMYRWHLSFNHPKRDECDDWDGRLLTQEQAETIYPLHDNCLCWLSVEPQADTAAIARLAAAA